MSFPIYVLTGMLVAVGALSASALAKPKWLSLSIALAGAIAVLLIGSVGFFNVFADDSFITLRYSKHLADGLGPNWNSHGRVEGYTCFLWMGLLAGVDRIGIDPVRASRWLGLAAAALTMLVLYGIWRLWSDEEPDSGLDHPAVWGAAVAGLALTDGVAFWSYSGMETPLFMLLLTLSGFLYLRERRGALLPLSAIALAATAMTRPEGVIAILVTGVFVMVDLLGGPRDRHALVRAALWGGTVVFLYGAYFLWRYTYYDSQLPNTFYAKVQPTGAVYNRGIEYLWTSGLRYQLLPLFGGLGLLCSRRKLQRDAAYIAALAGALLIAVIFEGGDDFPHGRLVIPVLPLLYLGGLAGFALVVRQLPLATLAKGALVAAVLTLAALSLMRASHEASPAREREALAQREELGKWLTANTPKDYVVAAFAVGAIGYYTDRDVLDLLGLNDVTIAHTDVSNFGKGLAGHEKYNIDYVLGEVRPQIIIIDDAEGGPVTEPDLRARAQVPSPVQARNALFADERLWNDYDVRSLQLGPHWYNFLQRADTVGDLQGRGLR